MTNQQYLILTYAKSELKLYDLFNDNNDIASCVPLYHSSSTYGVIDSLSSSFNSANIPDFTTKSTFSMNVNQGNLKFWKLGLPATGSDYRLNIFKSDVLDDDTVITNYLDSSIRIILLDQLDHFISYMVQI